MRMLRDALECMRGLGTAAISMLPEKKKDPFFGKAQELGRQIAADNNVPYESADLQPEKVLSPRAEELLKELKQIKESLLLS